MHEPVLLQEVLDCLTPQKGERYLDVTAGYGGHASALLRATRNFHDSVLVDRDQMAIDHLTTLFADSGISILHDDFATVSADLRKQGKKFDLILADLGVSSPHLNMASRGFSFQLEGPLDMRMDRRQKLTAAHIVNQWSAENLEQILRTYGEEPHARRISKVIEAHRPFETTDQLAQTIAQTTGKWQGKHPATRTFQALRIAVNNELGLLVQALPDWQNLLAPGGRLAIISFHSLEDRIVKQYFAEHGQNTYDADLTILTKSPVVASDHEVVSNPRSRSAKLRVAQRK